jgi:4-amino-4-deoxy-L-arabinose transferase-like glycosyltransferase
MNDESVARTRWSRIDWIGASGVLLAITAGLVVRAFGVGYALPYVYHPDEPTNLEVIQRIATESLNPKFFQYPSLFFYLQAAAHWVLRHVGVLLGTWKSAVDLRPVMQTVGNGVSQHPSVFLVGRSLSVVFSVATMVLAAWHAKAISGKWLPAVVAAAVLATSQLSIESASLITPDTYTGFFTLLALAASLRILKKSDVWTYVIAGAAVGLAAGAKYNAGFVAVALLASHILRLRDARRWPSLREWLVPLAAAMVAAAAAFALSTPYALVTPQPFVNGILYEASHYRTGHAGAEGDSARFYLSTLWSSEGVALIAACLALFNRSVRREAIVTMLFVVGYLAFISSFKVHFPRNLLPGVPLLAVLGGLGVQWVGTELSRRIPARALFIVGAVVALAFTAQRAVRARDWVNARQIDGRAEARAWLEAHVAPSSRILVEAYSPWVDPARFTVLRTLFLARRSGPGAEGVDVALITPFGSGRFQAQPSQYRTEVARLEELRRKSCRREFVESGGERFEFLVFQCAVLR